MAPATVKMTAMTRSCRQASTVYLCPDFDLRNTKHPGFRPCTCFGTCSSSCMYVGALDRLSAIRTTIRYNGVIQIANEVLCLYCLPCVFNRSGCSHLCRLTSSTNRDSSTSPSFGEKCPSIPKLIATHSIHALLIQARVESSIRVPTTCFSLHLSASHCPVTSHHGRTGCRAPEAAPFLSNPEPAGACRYAHACLEDPQLSSHDVDASGSVHG